MCSVTILRTIQSAIVLFLMFMSLSCDSESPDTPEEYLALITDPGSGLSKERVVGNVKMHLQYMPPEFFALKETGKNRGVFDSILDIRKHGINFVLQLDTKEGNQDIMGHNLHGFEDYQNRVMVLNFDIKNYISLSTQDTVIHPVLAALENTYGLSTGRKLIVAFAGDVNHLLSDSKQFDIVFDDPVFETGISRFNYKTQDILQAPKPQL